MSIDDRREHALKRAKAKREFRSVAGIAIFATVVVNVVWLATGSENYWPLWAMIALAVMLAFSAYSAYGPRDDAPTEDEVARGEEDSGR